MSPPAWAAVYAALQAADASASPSRPSRARDEARARAREWADAARTATRGTRAFAHWHAMRAFLGWVA